MESGIELLNDVKDWRGVFKTKDSSSHIERYKAKVAKGLSKKERIDYREIFSLIWKKDSFT